MKTLQKTILVILLMIIPFTFKIHASNQGDKDYKVFCEAMGKLIAATDDGFEKITWKIIDSAGGVRKWNSKVGLPGVVKSRIVDEMVISKYYLGEYKGTKKIDDIKVQYEKYAQYLDKYMTSIGYHIQKSHNEDGADDFDDIIYRMAKDSPLPIEKQPFIKMNVNYNDETK